MIVVDANVWLAALVDAGSRGQTCRSILVDDPDWAMPSHCPLEVLRALSKYELVGKLSLTAANQLAQAVTDATPNIITLTGADQARLWQMRHNVSVYDAPYLLIALMFDTQLVTCDQRLSRAATALNVQIRLVP